MGFADEVAQAKSERGATKPAVVAAAAVADAVMDTTNELNGPVDGQPATPAPEPTAAPVEATPAPVEAKKTRVRIGTKEFDNYDDAMSYAQELELSQAEADGYKKAVDELKPKETVAPTKKASEEIAEMIFENPTQAIEKIETLIEERVNKKADEIRADEVRKTQLASVWSDFYQSNPELQAHDVFVKHLLQNVHWKELGYIPSSQAMPKLAEIAKRELKIVRESTLPAETLPVGRATVAPTSSTATKVVAQKDDSPLDFISQLNSIRKRVKQ